MPRDFRREGEALGVDDARLVGRDCFKCGQKIATDAAGCWVDSPVPDGIAVSGHRSCVSRIVSADPSGLKLAAAYQEALYAALAGKKERAH